MQKPPSPITLPSLLCQLVLFSVAACPAFSFEIGDYQSDSGALSKAYVAKAWTVEDGLPQSSVTSVVQMQDGYMWIGTFGGLARFDGREYTVYDVANQPGLKSNRILSLHESPPGTLWIGTENDGLCRYADGVFSTVTTKARIWDIAGGAETGLWIGTDVGVSRLLDGEWSHFGVREGLPGPRAGAVHVDRDGVVWAGTESGVARFDSESLTFRAPETDVPSYGVNCIAEDSSGVLWFGTRAGVLVYSQGAFSRVLLGEEGQTEGTAIAIDDEDDRVWIASLEAVYLIAGAHSESPTVSRTWSEPERWGRIRCLLLGRERNVWVATDRLGLQQLAPRVIRLYTTEDGLPQPSVRPIIADGEGGILFGAGCGSLTRYRDGRFEVQRTAGAVPLGCVRSLLLDSEGKLWIGHDRILTGTKDGVYEHWDDRRGLPVHNIQSIFEDREKNLWVGYDGAGLVKMSDAGIEHFTSEDGLVDDIVIFATQDSKGALWLGGNNGVTRIDGGTLTALTPSDGLSHGPVRSIHEDGDGVLWMGTYGGGLTRMKDGDFFRYTVDDGLYENVVSRILEDDQRNLWMLGNRGLSRVSLESLNDYAEGRTTSVSVVSFGYDVGMREGNGGSQPSGCRLPDGTIWVPSVDGLIAVRPDRYRANTAPPIVTITGIEANRAPVGFADGVQLDPDLRNVRFGFTAITFTEPEKAKFEFMLDGYDEDWVSAGSHRYAHYTNLKPGRYDFLVRAANNSGVWSHSTASVSITLNPHYYETRWFAVSLVLVVIAALILIHRLRLRDIRRINRILRAEIEHQQRGETRRLLALERKLHGEKLLSIGRLAGGIAHDQNNLLAIISGYTELLQANNRGDDHTKRHLKQLLGATKRVATLSSKLLTLGRDQASEKERFGLAELADYLLELTAPLVPESVDLQVHAKPGSGQISVEPGELDRVMTNIVINACEAMPEGGRITIEVGVVRIEEDDASLVAGDYVAIDVSDDGVGVAAPGRELIFEPFFSTKSDCSGVGMGLAIVQSIARRCGGSIQLVRSDSTGSTFRLLLPTSEEPVGEMSASPSR